MHHWNKIKGKTFTCILAIFLSGYYPIYAQQNISAQMLMKYGKVYYDPADSLPPPTTIQELIPDFPEHDSIYYRLTHTGKGEDCWSWESTDTLGKCFKNMLRRHKPGETVMITDCYYYYRGEKSYLPDLYLILDDRLRLREWKR